MAMCSEAAMSHPNPHPQDATDWVSIFHGKMLLPLDKHPLHPMGNEVRHARGPRDIFRDMVPTLIALIQDKI